MPLWLAYNAVNIKTIATYRVNFAIAVLANLVHYGVSLLLIDYLIARFGSIAGWGKEEVFLLYATALMSFSIFGLFGQHLGNFGSLVIRGDLDRLLLRPRSLYAQVVLGGVNLIYVTHLIFSISLLVYALSGLRVEAGELKHIYLFASIILGAVLQMSVAMAASALSFWIADSSAIFNTVIYTSREMIWYPLDIYSKNVQVALIFLMPFGLINYVPVSYFLGHPSFGDIGIVPFIGFVMIPAIFFGANELMKRGIARYSSSGN